MYCNSPFNVSCAIVLFAFAILSQNYNFFRTYASFFAKIFLFLPVFLYINLSKVVFCLGSLRDGKECRLYGGQTKLNGKNNE